MMPRQERIQGALTRVSIVTTCLNAASTIRRTIESILSQQGDFTIEYIITDAGSTDGTRDIIAEFGEQIRLIDAQKLNQSQGINLGLKEAGGDILAYLNADDLYAPGAIQKVVDSFKKYPLSQWLVGHCRIIDEHDTEMQSWISSYKNFLLRHYSYFLLLSENFICQPAVFFRRSLLESHGYFSERENLVMDYEYWLRIGKGNTPVVLGEQLAAFRRMASTKSNRAFTRQFKDDLRVGCHYAVRSGKVLAIPLKFFNYLKTICIYSFLYRSVESHDKG